MSTVADLTVRDIAAIMASLAELKLELVSNDSTYPVKHDCPVDFPPPDLPNSVPNKSIGGCGGCTRVANPWVN